MPWTAASFAARHNQKLKGAAASKSAAQANAMLRAGVSEGVAIATANKHAKHGLGNVKPPVKKFARGGPVQPHLRMSPNHKHTPMPITAMAGPMMPSVMPETNIHGIPIRRPMPMNMSRR